MGQEYTSAYSGPRYTVQQMIDEPTFIAERIYENMEGADIAQALFRDGGDNNGVVAFMEAAAPFLDQDAERVAEFAEIPVAHITHGKMKSIIGQKIAVGIKISREMSRRNKQENVERQITALQNTMIRGRTRACIAAFNSSDAGIHEVAVTAPWKNDNADPIRDLFNAIEEIMNSPAPNMEDEFMGYMPDTLLVGRSDLNNALFHKEVQKFYNGNIADANPIFTGIMPASLADLRIVNSRYLKPGEVYILESGTAGFVSEADPFTVTDLYSPDGENGHGGKTQSWRVDAFEDRVIALDNPKSVAKLVGVST